MAAQVLAILIFLAMFILIITEIWERHVITLGCALLTLVLVFGFGMHSMSAIMETLNVGSIFTPQFWYTAGQSGEASSGINWETIVFVAGMMIMVEGMAQVGFFRWLCMRIAKAVKYQVIPIFLTFMILSGFLAMFIDSITVILFLAAVTVELSQMLKFNPVPMILSEIFCANLGGSATMCGDPPNIIIGTSLGYSFSDFITNTGLIAGVSLIAVILYFYLVFHRQLRAQAAAGREAGISVMKPEEAITSKKGFVISCIIFLCAVVLLVTHAQTGLTVSFIGVLIGVVTLIASGKQAPTLLKRIDYKTLLFFIGLFVVVGGLEQTGILQLMAAFIGNISNGNVMLILAIILWLSAIASAFIDNIPFAATMIPIINSLAAAQGVDLSVLAWALAMGTDVGGSATPIGASANVVGIATAAKNGHIIKWGRYCKVMAPATIMVVAISMLMIYWRYL
ncbi:MAG TPA: citrate transporter [Candidatus Acetatifactor stercoripullorum]|uniref:Citrate transporter n=1 Tax=Candidatus Acetatifactor stercoripullorum TaxID=2838414 RepID=A0A9D1R4S4_9FIRM|nr:SLC13 family permease [uncultured Acetatifactor sp.]HIW80092.1 citrate transporter [Candidatus Acetatifactor stercoripullorum]